MIMATLIKEFNCVNYSSRGLVHYHHGREHSGTQADMVLEKLKVLHLDPEAAGRERLWAGMGFYNVRAHLQPYTSSN